MQILKDNIKTKILEEAANTFLDVGYDKTTMRQIARRAEISVGNIYRYFKSKEKILEELILDFELELKDFSESLDPNLFTDDTQKMCDDFIDKLIKLLKKHYIAITVLFQNISNKRFGEFRVLIIKSISEKIMIVAKSLKQSKITINVARAVAAASIEGISMIITESGKFDKSTEKDLRIYLSLILRDLVFRIKEV